MSFRSWFCGESRYETPVHLDVVDAAEHLDPAAIRAEQILMKKLDNVRVKTARRHSELRHTLAHNTLLRIHGG